MTKFKLYPSRAVVFIYLFCNVMQIIILIGISLYEALCVQWRYGDRWWWWYISGTSSTSWKVWSINQCTWLFKLTQHVFNFGLAKINRELSSKLCDFVLKLNFTRCCFLTKIQFGPHVGLVDTTVKLKNHKFIDFLAFLFAYISFSYLPVECQSKFLHSLLQ